jgi:hypothetical protein
MEEFWDGEEAGLPYFFPRSDLQQQVYKDLKDWFVHISGEGWIQELIADYVLNPTHVCVLSVLKAISDIYPNSRHVYRKYIEQLKQSYKRDEILPVLSEMASAANVELIVYRPETRRWHIVRGLQPSARCKIVTTGDSIHFGWVGRRVTGTLGDIHVSDWQESYMSVATSIISEMFNVNVYRCNGSYKIEGNVSRTASEAAQRVLLHALQSCKLTSYFPYKIDAKKSFSSCITKYEKTWNSLHYARGRVVIPVVPEDRPKSAVTRCKMETTTPDKLKKIEVLRETAEKKIMKAEDEYVQGRKDWAKEQHTRSIIAWKEVMRELEVKNDLKYKERIEVSKSHKPPMSLRRIKELLDEKTLLERQFYRKEVNEKILAMIPTVKLQYPTLPVPSLRNIARRDFGLAHPEILEAHEKMKEAVKQLEKEFDDFGTRPKVPPPESIQDIELDIRSEMNDRRRGSPTVKVIIMEDPVYAEKVARLQFLRNISKKNRELGLEVMELQKFVKENSPVLEIRRDKPHKARTMLPPRPPDSSSILKRLDEDIKQVMAGPARKIVKKEAVERKENLNLLVEEVANPNLSKEKIVCSNQALKMRSGLLTRVQKFQKRNKEPDTVWKGIKTQRSLKQIPLVGLDENDPMKSALSRMIVASSFRQVVGSARRSLLHSGRLPKMQELALDNKQAYALASIAMSEKPRKFLRMFLPNNISNRICSHRGTLINQRFQ